MIAPRSAMMIPSRPGTRPGADWMVPPILSKRGMRQDSTATNPPKRIRTIAESRSVLGIGQRDRPSAAAQAGEGTLAGVLRALVTQRGGIDGSLVGVPPRVGLMRGRRDGGGVGLVAVHRVEQRAPVLGVLSQGLGVLHDVGPDHVHRLDDFLGDALRRPDTEVVGGYARVRVPVG